MGNPEAGDETRLRLQGNAAFAEQSFARAVESAIDHPSSIDLHVLHGNRCEVDYNSCSISFMLSYSHTMRYTILHKRSGSMSRTRLKTYKRYGTKIALAARSELLAPKTVSRHCVQACKLNQFKLYSDLRDGNTALNSRHASIATSSLSWR